MLVVLLAISLAACSTSTSGGPAANNQGEAAESTGNAAAESAELTIVHDLGETKVQKNPDNVVVFDFGVLETLDVLGVEVKAVAQASLPPHLDKYADAKYENAGSLKEPDFETLASLDPGLILISGRQSAAYEELSKIGPTVFMGVDTANYMESFKNNVTQLGEIFGKEAEAEAELAAISETIEGLQTSGADGQKALIVLTTGGKVSAYGPGSRFGIIHDVFGVAPADEDIVADTHGMSVSFEYIMEKNPDILFVIDRDAVVDGGGSSAKEVIENELVKNTNAYKNGKIVYLNPGFWYLSGGGLTSVAEMAAEVEAGLQ